MSSLAGRVSAVAGAFLTRNYTEKQSWSCFNTLSLPRPLLPTPILTCKLELEKSSTIGLLPNNNPLLTSHRWSCRSDSVVEECTSTGTMQDYQVRKASVVIIWNIFSVLTTFAFCRLDWVDDMCRRGQEYIEPRAKQLKIQYEQARYWAFVSCILLFWLYVAFFLHLRIQQWEMSTMYPSSDAFDPGGSFCHPTLGLGCQLSFR